MSKIWSGLRNGLKFRCTACGKCCNNKRSNVSLNLSEVDTMSEFMGMNKLTFLDKYTEEKIIDGQTYTKLAHKKDLSCILLDIEIVLGEAEWMSEAKKCEGIRIDSSLSAAMLSTTDSAVDELSDSTSTSTADGNILYDGVIADFENTVHGNERNYLKTNEVDSSSKIDVDRSLAVSESGDMTVHPDTIMRQLILHEIHAEGLGPDWSYQDSLELLLESEEQSLESEGNVLEDFKNEYCQNNFSRTVFEDNGVRVVDTTTPFQPLPELLLNIENTSESSLSDERYNYDLSDFRIDLQLNTLENSQDEDLIQSDDVTMLVTKRRFEFVNSSNMVQTELYLRNPSTQGLAEDEGKGNSESLPVDKKQLIMPIHQILSVLCEKRISNWNANVGGKEGQVVAIIGAGGFALPSHLQALYPALSVSQPFLIDAVEPAEVVLDTARNHFNADFSWPERDGENRGVGVGSSAGAQSQIAAARIRAHHTDGLSYLQNIVNNQAMSGSGDISTHIDCLIIDAFEDNPNEGSVVDLGPNSRDYCPTRAPPLSLLSDPALFVKCLTPMKSVLSGDIPHTNSEGQIKDGKKVKTQLSDTVTSTGGLLAINLFGPDKWVVDIFSKISSCPGLSQPILIRLKGQKNILLLTSRTSE